MQQVFLIHGGHAHNSYEAYLEYLQSYEIDLQRSRSRRWKENLPERLGSGFEVVAPSMPCKQNAKYLEWKIWFEKYLPLLRNGVVLVGHSLGGLFLAKYLSENRMSVKVSGTFLIAAPMIGTTRNPQELADFNLNESLEHFADQAGEVVIFHSHDDQVVPYSNAESYLESLPGASLETFEDRGHFNDEFFPELEDRLRELSSRT